LIEAGLFDHDNYFDVFTEFAKEDEEDILVKITIHNRSDEDAPVTLLPQIWFRNLWSFGLMDTRPIINNEKANKGYGAVTLQHPELGEYYYYYETPAHTLFTENESNNEKLWQAENKSPFVKDLFHTAVVNDNVDKYKDNQ